VSACACVKTLHARESEGKKNVVSEAAFAKIVTLAFVGAAAIVLARNAYGKRHWIAWNVARFVVLLLAVVGVRTLASVIGLRGWWVKYVAVGLATPAYFALEWKRTRRIPAAMRREIIQEWEARTGRQFDPQVYEIDHKVPFAKGGWHTIDNLRVVRRDANRRKGHREPALEDWFHIWKRKDEN
jgi:hypothetical protein